MGKKARLKKEAVLAKIAEEKALIEERSRLKRAPLVRSAVKLTLVLVVTIGLLYLGTVVNKRLMALAQEAGESI